MPGPERVLTWVRWACGDDDDDDSEPMDKLDATASPW